MNYLGDFAGGSMFLAVGVLAALLAARASGAGQVVDAAMVDGASYLGSMTRSMLADGLWTDKRGDNALDGASPNYRCYRCADGRYVVVGAPEPRFWAALVQGLGGKPEDVPSPYARQDWDRCRQYLAEAFAGKTRDEWAGLFEGTDACVTPVLTLTEATGHRHNTARNAYLTAAGAVIAGRAPASAAPPAAAFPRRQFRPGRTCSRRPDFPPRKSRR